MMVFSWHSYLFGDIQVLGDTDFADIVIVEEDVGTEADGRKVELVDDKLAGKESIVQMLLVFFGMIVEVTGVSQYFDNDFEDIEFDNAVVVGEY